MSFLAGFPEGCPAREVGKIGSTDLSGLESVHEKEDVLVSALDSAVM
jgi:hypothetical protein